MFRQISFTSILGPFTTALLCLVLALSLPRAAHAQLVYTEGADLANTGATALGTVGTGTNTITGSISAIATQFSPTISGDIADRFSVIVPSGMHITSVRVGINSTNTNVSFPAIFECTTPNSGMSSLTIPIGPLSFSNQVTAPFGMLPGTYTFAFRHNISGFSNNVAAMGYTITILASPCFAPEPQASGDDCSIRITLPAGGPPVTLYRRNPIVQIAQLAAGQTTYNDPQPPGTTATYFVVLDPADSPCGGTQGYFSADATATSNTPAQPSPITGITADGCSLTWTNPNGAQFVTLTLQREDNVAEVFSTTIAASAIPFSLPPTFDLNLLAADRRAFWRLESFRTCNGLNSPVATTFSSNFTVIGTMAQPTINAVNGLCSVIITPHISPGASSYRVIRSSISDGSTVYFNSPALPSFEDTSAVPSRAYVYTIEASGCNGTVSASTFITVARTPAGGARPNLRISPGQTATLDVGAIPAGADTAFIWRRGGVSSIDPSASIVLNGAGGGRFSGVNSSILTIQRVEPGDTDTYWCSIYHPCGTTVISFNLFLNDGCRADFNRSGSANVQDIFDFLSTWFAGCP